MNGVVLKRGHLCGTGLCALREGCGAAHARSEPACALKVEGRETGDRAGAEGAHGHQRRRSHAGPARQHRQGVAARRAPPGPGILTTPHGVDGLVTPPSPFRDGRQQDRQKTCDGLDMRFAEQGGTSSAEALGGRCGRYGQTAGRLRPVANAPDPRQRHAKGCRDRPGESAGVGDGQDGETLRLPAGAHGAGGHEPSRPRVRRTGGLRRAVTDCASCPVPPRALQVMPVVPGAAQGSDHLPPGLAPWSSRTVPGLPSADRRPLTTSAYGPDSLRERPVGLAVGGHGRVDRVQGRLEGVVFGGAEQRGQSHVRAGTSAGTDPARRA